LKTKHTLPLRAIAQIVGLFGVRGEMKILSYARTAEEFEGLKKTFIGKNETATEQCSIESVRKRGNEIYVKLNGIDNRTAAETCKGMYLFVEESEKKQPPKEKFFIDDLVGCVLVNEAGKRFGEVISVDALPAQMAYTVKTESGEVMFPAVPEFVLSVDVVKKEILVRPPEGLFDGDML
jgi:16S rRNA processing protein RimM